MILVHAAAGANLSTVTGDRKRSVHHLEAVAVNVRGRSFKIAAEVDVQTPEASGVLFAHGSKFGGHALYLKDGKLKYVYN